MYGSPVENTTLGASYHAATNYTLKGHVEAKNMKIATRTGIIDTSYKHKAQLDVTMPERVMLSGTHQLNDQWTVMADATWTRWSALDHVKIIDKEANPPLQNGSAHLALNWKNTWALSAGTAYKLNDQWTLKAGYMYDQSPVNDKNRTVRTPDADRNWFTAGAKWDLNQDITFDFSAAYVMLKDGKLDQGEHKADGSERPEYGRVTGLYKNQSTFIFGGQMTYRF